MNKKAGKLNNNDRALAKLLRRITTFIEEVEDRSQNAPLNDRTNASFEKRYSEIEADYKHINGSEPFRYLLHELRALIEISKDDYDSAQDALNQGYILKPDSLPFASKAGHVYTQSLKKPDNTHKRRHRRFSWSGVISVIIFFFVILSYAYEPISNYFAVRYADPKMVLLAEQAGLNDEGKKWFLRNKPELVQRSSLNSVCGIEDTELPEFGCYIPAENKIYLGDVASEFDALEAVFAAHEMLHAAYTNDPQINSLLERYAATISDDSFEQRMAVYEKVEPGARLDELHSIIGSEYGNLPQELESYYSKYFFNRNQIVETNTAVFQLFSDYETQIEQINRTIKQKKLVANRYYQNHVFAARNGLYNSYHYNWNLYNQTLDEVDRLVNQVNSLIDRYNVLTGLYNGDAFSGQTTIAR
jgi:hypothetical protein